MPLAFVELEFAHALGPPPGRYLLADGDVLIIDVRGGPLPPVLPRRRRARATPVGDEPDRPVSLAVARLVRSSDPVDDPAALVREWRADDALRERTVAAALEVLNTAIRAFRIAAQNPYVTEVGRWDPRAVRLGWGTPEEVDAGRSSELLAVRRHRGSWGGPPLAQRLAPDELVAALLRTGGTLSPAHDVLLRGLLDLAHGRPDAARAQASAALELVVAAEDLPLALGPEAARLRDRVRAAGDVGEISAALDATGEMLLRLRDAELSVPPR
ncbi:MAG: hypothetical protein AB7G37_06990 [Solirubrobacteraceae bacterium]